MCSYDGAYQRNKNKIITRNDCRTQALWIIQKQLLSWLEQFGFDLPHHQSETLKNTLYRVLFLLFIYVFLEFKKEKKIVENHSIFFFIELIFLMSLAIKIRFFYKKKYI